MRVWVERLCTTIVLGAMSVLGLVILAGAFIGAFAFLVEKAGANQLGVIDDEPLITTEVQTRRSTITSGVVGNDAIFIRHDRRSGSTTGVVGDSPVFLTTPDRRFNVRLHMENDYAPPPLPDDDN